MKPVVPQNIKQVGGRTLQLAEQYLKIDMRYFASGSFWSVTGQVASAFATLAFAMVVSRVLPKEVYGEYKYILAAVALLSTFSLNSLSQAVFQSTACGFDGALQEGFWTNLRWSFLVFIGAFAFAAYYFLFHNIELAVGILIGGCLSPILAGANFANSFLAGKKDFARRAIYFVILETFISVAALILTVFLTKNPLILVAVYFLSNTLATLYFYLRVVKVYRPDPYKTDPEMLSYGKHLSFLGIVGGIVGELDQVLLFHYVGPVQLAIYNFAIGIPDQLKGPLKDLDTMLQARFVHYLPKNIRSGMRNKSLLLFIFALIIITAYIILAPFIFRILFPAYMSAVPYTQLYMLSYLAIPFSPSGSYLSSKKLVREIYINNGVSYVLQIVGMMIGVIGWGLLGLICSIVIIRLLSGVVSYVLYRIASGKADNVL